MMRAISGSFRCACVYVLLTCGAHASPERDELSLGGATVRYRGTPVAYFTASGDCAVKNMKGGGWAHFSSGDHTHVAGAFPATLGVTATTPTSQNDTARLSMSVGLDRRDGDGLKPWLSVHSVIRSKRDVPLFLADFVSLTCWIEHSDQLDALENVRALPRPARRWVVNLISVAALMRYKGIPEDLMGHDQPHVFIPIYAKRCGSGRDCDVWVNKVRRGFFGSRGLEATSGEGSQ